MKTKTILKTVVRALAQELRQPGPSGPPGPTGATGAMGMPGRDAVPPTLDMDDILRRAAALGVLKPSRGKKR